MTEAVRDLYGRGFSRPYQWILFERLRAKWQGKWESCPGYGKHTRKWFPKAIPCVNVKTWDKQEIGLIVRLVTGHGPFRYHIGKCEQDPAFDTTCDLCEEGDQTANHLILECPAFSTDRRNNTDFWSVIMNNSPIETDTKMEVLQDFVINTNVLKSAFQIYGVEKNKYESLVNAHC